MNEGSNIHHHCNNNTPMDDVDRNSHSLNPMIDDHGIWVSLDGR